MRFRRFIIPLVVTLTMMFSWNLVCTWKKNKLQQEAISELKKEYNGKHIPSEVVEAHLQNKYNEDRPIWNLPLLGKMTYKKLGDHTIRKGPDMVGGNIITLGADTDDVLLRNASLESSRYKRFKDALEATEKTAKDNESDYIKAFIKQLKKVAKTDDIRRYFNFEDASKLDESTIISRLKQRIKDGMEKIAPTLRARINPNGDEGYNVRVDNDGQHCTLNTPSSVDESTIDEYINNPGEFCLGKALQGDKMKAILKEVEVECGLAPYTFKHEKLGKNSFYSLSKAMYEKHQEQIQSVANGKMGPNQRFFLYPLKNNQDGISVFIVETGKKRHFDLEKIEKIENTDKERLNRGRWEIRFTLDKTSHEALGALSKEIYRSGDYLDRLMIMLDGKLLMTPKLDRIIKEKDDRTHSITGIRSDEATNIVRKLKSGVLPFKMKKISSISVAPTLSSAAQSRALSAIIIALLIILLFVAFYYAVAGLVANVSLMLNVIFILGTLARFQTTLTLTGIAGIVLTIGMAVDANILIFEWIREGLRRGETKKNAIRNGYRQAFRSLFDSYLTTLIIGGILLASGGPSVRGFAITLLIGIMATFVTGVLCSQIILETIMKVVGEKRTSFSIGFTERFLTNTKINFLGKRKYAYLFSLLFIGGGMILTYQKGPELGIDFTGGKEYIVRTSKENTKVEHIEKGLEETFAAARKGTDLPKGSLNVLSVAQKDDNNEASYVISTNFAVTNDKIDVEDLVKKSLAKTWGAEYKTFTADEEKKLPANVFTFDGTKNIEKQQATKYAKEAVWAVVLALILMLCYIFISFKNFGLALAALIALGHDVLALITCLSIAKLCGTGYTIDPMFITTILTIIGYSINDTCVIFNHIRHRMKEENTDDLNKVTNGAINRTMSRTSITSLTTFIPVFILYFFGGIALELLAFSLIWGILWGTYSSVFLAGPIACDLSRFFAKITKRTKRKKQGKVISQPRP